MVFEKNMLTNNRDLIHSNISSESLQWGGDLIKFLVINMPIKFTNKCYIMLFYFFNFTIPTKLRPLIRQSYIGFSFDIRCTKRFNIKLSFKSKFFNSDTWMYQIYQSTHLLIYIYRTWYLNHLNIIYMYIYVINKINTKMASFLIKIIHEP